MTTLDDVNVEAELRKFDAWRLSQLPAITALNEPQVYQKLLHLSESWQQTYAGSEGYLRVQRLISQGGGALPVHVLVQKLEIAEKACLDLAERFIAEYRRLGLKPIVS